MIFLSEKRLPGGRMLMENTIDLKPIKIWRVSVDRFFRLAASERSNVKHACFVPPSVGSSGFGFFELVLKRAVYRKPFRRSL
jgi:hypothetical protein